MIVRGPRPDRYTTLSNACLRDERLSYRARGVLAYVLSQPNGYRCTAQDLADHGKEGRDAMLTALAELESAGYLVRRKYQDDRGQWRNESTVYDEPVTGNPISDTSTSKTEVLEEGLNPLSTDVDLRLVQCEVAQPFDPFWSAYPLRNGKRLGKAKASTKWDRMNQRERAEAMVGVVNYAKACERGRLPKDAERWLRDRCWEEWQEPERYDEPSDISRAAQTDANALARTIQERGF